MKTIALFLLTFFALATPSLAQEEGADAQKSASWNETMPPIFSLNTDYSKMMFDRQNNVTDKPLQQQLAVMNGDLQPYHVYWGGRFIGTVMHERTNTDGKFPILSRLPPSHTRSNSDTVDVINDASVNVTLVLPYVTGFAQGEYTEVEYPGQDEKQIRKYYVTIGNLEMFPVYATIGKNTVNFGDMSSYAPFTHSHNSHYFWAQTDEPSVEIGYYKDGTHVAATLIKNDRGLRVINSPENDDKYQNFAVNGSQKIQISDEALLKIGAGFLRGTIYDSTLAHHPPSTGLDDRFWAGAWNANATLSYKNVDVMAEFTRTLEDWPATDSKVHALTLQARYKDQVYDIPVTYSLMYSQGIQGDDGDEWESMHQTVAGIEIELMDNVSLGFEYVNNLDFVPLIQPRRTADDGVVSHTGIAGLKITF
jgi:opacity protein-like surface antigen